MTPRLSHRLDAVARILVPALLGIVLVLISTIPFQIPGFGPVAPNFVLMAVFFWGVHRVYLFSNIFVFFYWVVIRYFGWHAAGLKCHRISSSENRRCIPR